MSEAAARSFVEAASIQWYQRFELAPGVYTPGTRDVSWVYEHARVPTDLSGLSVLDVGTTNGGVAFEAERRGAARVVAVDICSPDVYGFSDLRTFFGSRVEYREATVYDLARTFEDRFDVVFFLGVLYHLRHPLLALDNLRELPVGSATSKRRSRMRNSASRARCPSSGSTEGTSWAGTRPTGSRRRLLPCSTCAGRRASRLS